MVLHIYSRICLSLPDLPPRLHEQAHGEPMEDLCQALCRPHEFTWSNKGFLGFPQLPCSDNVQVHKGKLQKYPFEAITCNESETPSMGSICSYVTY